jgi:hypothetical protein
MTSKQLENTQPLAIDVNETGDQIVITMPLAPMDCKSESGKMNVLCTTNGWIKTQIPCPRTAEMIQVNIFVGTRA